MIESVIYMFITFAIAAVCGKFTIPVLRRLKVGQSERAEGPSSHLQKQGTPTMGGVIMIIALVIVLVIISIIKFEMAKVILPIALAAIGFGIVGFVDDYKKVVLKNTDGLNPKLKMLGLLIISVLYSVYLVKFTNINNEIFIPIVKSYISLPIWIYIPFIIFVMLGTTNAVNLNDGVDGLCASGMAIIFTAFSTICFKLAIPEVSVLSTIFAGACLGFLIYNVHKAKVFMGDTGSLLLGGALAAIAIFVKMPLLLVLMAIIPVVETLSVMIQVTSFKLTGKRVFKMSPIHHHFELCGWKENKVVLVFDTVTLIASILGILLV